MKKGIEVFQDYDNSGRWRLTIEKKRGKLTLEEIKETAREYEWDFYLLVLDCFHEDGDVPYGYEAPQGDRAELYRTDLFWKEGER